MNFFSLRLLLACCLMAALVDCRAPFVPKLLQDPDRLLSMTRYEAMIAIMSEVCEDSCRYSHPGVPECSGYYTGNWHMYNDCVCTSCSFFG
ncbi:hypothetical protein BOX15_Mlig002908g1 [Macrostomum lignano]|uniref:Secreted protein n=2 Tax=Macrostomum lignano TaxID=282301 RepID=A0A1I8G296_9PLAT|nr:hypothetical protein BOX15_Mlig002908g2 [Macrostomum lignano]PAA87550.1 hypothetical protein BOX15_Mlig002908g1 [Macrostomum lignano]